MTMFKVRLRRGKGFEVKQSAEVLDGNTYNFIVGWELTEYQEPFMIGEIAMIPRDDNYPLDAPAWISNADLIEVIK